MYVFTYITYHEVCVYAYITYMHEYINIHIIYYYHTPSQAPGLAVQGCDADLRGSPEVGFSGVMSGNGETTKQKTNTDLWQINVYGCFGG